jgi:hypothetical protein
MRSHRTRGRLAVVGFIFSAFASELAAAADDSCEPQLREVAGRLLISVLSAGEKPNDNPYAPGSPAYSSFDPFFKDPIEDDAYLHLKQFSPLRTGKLPVEIVGISNDSSFNSTAASMLARAKARFQGTQPNSLETFLHLAAGRDSALERALKALQSNATCTMLMNQNHLTSALPLIKIEILVESEAAELTSQEPGIPTWSSDEKHGSQAQWIEDGRHALGKEQWRGLTNRLNGGVVQLFINSCKSGKVAAQFDTLLSDGGCSSCFVASTNQNQDDYSGGSFYPTFNAAISDHGAKLQTPATNYWPGASSITEMVPLLYEKHQMLIFPPTKTNPYKFIKATAPRNPLAAFIYTSADALAEDAFTRLAGMPNPSAEELTLEDVIKLTKSSKLQDIAKGDYYAQTTGELSAETRVETQSNEDLKAILERVDRIERSYAPILKEGARKIGVAEFKSHMNLFAQCTKKSSHTPGYCEKLIAKMDSAYLEKPSFIEARFQGSYDNFLQVWISTHSVEAMEAYLAGDTTAPDLFAKLELLRLSYQRMKEDLLAIANKPIREDSTLVPETATDVASLPKDQVRPEFQQALKFMTENFEAAYAGISKDVFDELRKDALRLKLSKIASRLVAQNPTALPRGYADAFLSRMRGKLVCLTEYAVGPKFDEQLPGPMRSPWLEKYK